MDNKNENAIPRRKDFVKGEQLRKYKATTISTILRKMTPGFYKQLEKESCSQKFTYRTLGNEDQRSHNVGH